MSSSGRRDGGHDGEHIDGHIDEYIEGGEGLDESEVRASPFLQARAWIDAALAASRLREDVPEPTALSVATVDASGAPNVRTVLMRYFDERGPGFVTNLDSDKSRELRASPAIAAALTWPALHRAIRFRGRAVPIGREEVEAYFVSRPYGSRLSAWASEQSRPAADRAELEQRWSEVLERFPDTGHETDVPLPDFWGGWRILCDEVEFWAGRANRLHDRIVFTRIADGDLAEAGAWERFRRQP
ncbi:pyridoxamine 5'-phosphate oxidase [Intrasporangium oryzae NRRL B-24470]|uniref:Pyridoxamine 5'-phosphate oxidase n=1 Tax=Intrasporangium oryzae NRRL B-24470 TaxID=1386089 RepID=W9G9Z0_9MICO|nr:pyridoxamine 5'-phosphate oxidase [Intrasporangium oryzae]EWT00689.1 pyridoxamine 5'-phosphate oxidase [Intrasporangium oryzae NRRL B-24470]